MVVSSVAEPEQRAEELKKLKLSPGAGAEIIIIYGSGSFLLVKRLEEILQNKIMVAKEFFCKLLQF
jgi:hypothetical protein